MSELEIVLVFYSIKKYFELFSIEHQCCEPRQGSSANLLSVPAGRPASPQPLIREYIGRKFFNQSLCIHGLWWTLVVVSVCGSSPFYAQRQL